MSLNWHCHNCSQSGVGPDPAQVKVCLITETKGNNPHIEIELTCVTCQRKERHRVICKESFCEFKGKQEL